MSVQVAGDRMERTIVGFVRACERLLEDEQQKPNPDNALISVLCDAIRLTRELEAAARSPIVAAAEHTSVHIRMLTWFLLLRRMGVRHVWLRTDLYWQAWGIFGVALFNADGHANICDVYIHDRDDRR